VAVVGGVAFLLVRPSPAVRPDEVPRWAVAKADFAHRPHGARIVFPGRATRPVVALAASFVSGRRQNERWPWTCRPRAGATVALFPLALA
jgi:hypothetical protein